jgi:hypothetical protein
VGESWVVGKNLKPAELNSSCVLAMVLSAHEYARGANMWAFQSPPT